MKETFEQKGRCCGCGACMDICPAGAVRMEEDGEGFLYPITEKEKCTGCGLCRGVCPVAGQAKSGRADTDGGAEKEGFGKDMRTGRGRIYMGARAKEGDVRFSSSSGGVFPVLAQYILSGGGIVFGAVMERGGRVVHRDIRSVHEIAALQKTKYVQSDLTGCFRKVSRYLKEGRTVLFTGTPCQCQAVKRYAGEDEKLLLADIVCYGVPSPGIWRKYVKELEQKYGGKLQSFSFRDKRGKDNGHTVSLQTDGKEYAWPLNRDAFCRVYFRNYILRPSCHFCPFSTTERESDITMGDFWGIERVRPEMDDGMGTSLVILHSEKGRRIWEETKDRFLYFRCREEDILQPRLCSPTPLSKGRGMFMALNRFLPLRLTAKLLFFKAFFFSLPYRGKSRHWSIKK